MGILFRYRKQLETSPPGLQSSLKTKTNTVPLTPRAGPEDHFLLQHDGLSFLWCIFGDSFLKTNGSGIISTDRAKGLVQEPIGSQETYRAPEPASATRERGSGPSARRQLSPFRQTKSRYGRPVITEASVCKQFGQNFGLKSSDASSVGRGVGGGRRCVAGERLQSASRSSHSPVFVLRFCLWCLVGKVGPEVFSPLGPKGPEMQNTVLPNILHRT